MHNPLSSKPAVRGAAAPNGLLGPASAASSTKAGPLAPALPGNFFEVTRSSQELGWQAITAVKAVTAIGEYSISAGNTLWLAMPSDDVRAVTEVDGKAFEVVARPGGAFIMQPKQKFVINNLAPCNALHVFVDESTLKSVADQIYGRALEGIDILDAFDSNDDGLGHLINAVHHNLDESQNEAWCADYMAHAIAAHVLSKHGRYRYLAPTPDSRAPISEGRLRQLREFFEANLDGNIDFAEMAASIGVGRTLFFERFKRTTGQTPNQFLQALRVKRAQQLLTKSNLSTAEVALAAGFTDQPHMTKIFRRLAGTTPARYRSGQ